MRLKMVNGVVDKTKTLETKEIWKNVLENAKVSVSAGAFSTWFSQTFLSSLKENEGRFIAEVGCASNFVKNQVENRYFGIIQDNLAKIIEAKCDLIFVVATNPEKKLDGDLAAGPLFEKEDASAEDINRKVLASGLRPFFTFKNFAVSSSNQMAYAAAEAVAKDLGKAYNPLFLWGGVGVGKTHLMSAVGYAAFETNRDANVILCTGEQFTNDIVEGIRYKNTPAVRNKYRRLSALLVDDIQFIAGKEGVQEEFFHTFNALVGAGAQVIMTSDKPPSEISKLEERLKSRFEAGLIVDIGQPDFELRCAIIQIKAKEKGIDLPMDMVQMISGNLDTARTIEGYLVKLLSETRFKGNEVTPDLIQRLLNNGEDKGVITSRATSIDVTGAVCKYFSLKKRDLLGASRAKPYSMPRQILMYLLRTQLGIPLQEVGRLVGRDHTTVMHAVDKISHLASENVQTREDLRGIKNML